METRLQVPFKSAMVLKGGPLGNSYLLIYFCLKFLQLAFCHQKKKNNSKIIIKLFSEFPGGPVIRTPCFHCRWHEFDP